MGSNSSTVLFVEDQESLLRLYHRVLEEHGYTVLTATDAMEALEKCQKYVGPIHLLIADIFLPMAALSGNSSNQPILMNGIQLSRAVKTLRPNIRVLFISGYPEKDIESIGGLPPNTTFLPKPFSPDTFMKKVRNLVNGVGPY